MIAATFAGADAGTVARPASVSPAWSTTSLLPLTPRAAASSRWISASVGAPLAGPLLVLFLSVAGAAAAGCLGFVDVARFSVGGSSLGMVKTWLGAAGRV